MYIKEITLDGFKSYAQQTVVSNFDPHFNAITGLNGSGKSNILDSICFVLGISNLAQVRATNLQELIYKGGNAGITRATVSITFDNMDKNQSPPGYHDYEEITITRQISTGNKHKYLINGQNATAQRVSDLFCSVQLNVNNPNFLIMQGKITKVLNMKPVEILSMIEEAAGTKMYDVKKANALQTIEKKNAKLNEIERVLREDITPQIEKLKLERAAYVEFQKCDREYLHLHKIAIAFQYWETECAASKSKADASEFQIKVETNVKRLEEIGETCERLRREIKEFTDGLKGKNGQADQNTQELEALENELKSIRMEVTKLNSQAKNINKSMDQERKRENEIGKSIKESKQSIASKEKKMEDMKSNVEKLELELSKAQAELDKAQKEYEALCCGFVIDEDSSQAQTLQDQVLSVRNKVSDKQTHIKKAQLRLDNGSKELDKLKKELASDTNTYKEKEAAFQKEKQTYEKMKASLDSLGFDQSKLDALNLDRRTMNAELRTLNDKIQDFYNKFPQFNFDYKDPEPNFDRSRVKGLVSNLFRIKDAKYATALETAAGGKLFNVVVDTDQTGKLILEKGELKRKVTIIPMNQIRAHTVSERAVQAARKLVGAENVHPAIDLVEFDPQYRAVMEYVFGSRLVCTTLDGAKQVAFNPNVMCSTITLDGDHFDPEGILSGGSRGERAQLLVKSAELKEQVTARNRRLDDVKKLETDIAKMNESSAK